MKQLLKEELLAQKTSADKEAEERRTIRACIKRKPRVEGTLGLMGFFVSIGFQQFLRHQKYEIEYFLKGSAT